MSTFILMLSSIGYFVFLYCLTSWVDLPTEKMVVLVFLPLMVAWLKYLAGRVRAQIGE